MIRQSQFLRTIAVLLVPLTLAAPAVGSLAAPAAEAAPVTLEEFTIDPAAMCELRERFVDRILAKYPEGTWAPMRMELEDEDLALMGLPSKEWLMSHRFPEPTMVTPDGTTYPVDLSTQTALAPTVATFGGTGCLGIRPGAWLLLIDSTGIGWCSLAHVYGAPGSYSVSTAGHCGRTGDIATVIAAAGNFERDPGVGRSVPAPVLLDFGKFSKSTGDGGIGKDWALISVNAPWQGLVSPTMCFWGGPVGMYTKTGSTVAASLFGRNLVTGPTLNTDPMLVQGVVHYGHGTGIGASGTPRAGTAFHWTTATMIWEGAITPGDSGSGSNTATGDTVGAQREAAGINTHIFVDPTLKTGIGILASTRATLVTATLANGQLVPYPAPVPGLP